MSGHRTAGIRVLLLTQLLMGHMAPQRLERTVCAPDAAATAWIGEMLETWGRAGSEWLLVRDTTLPTMVLFDAHCRIELRQAPGGDGWTPTSLRGGGAPVMMRAAEHDGQLRLPDGSTIPAELRASAGIDSTGVPYFAMALPSLWRADARTARHPDVPGLMRGVFLHEVTHTRQLGDVRREIEKLRARGAKLPRHVTDLTLQEMLEGDTAFAGRVLRERMTLFAAVREPDSLRSLMMARDALAALRERRSRWFVGPRAPLETVEDLFLNMEGIAEWVRHRQARHEGASIQEATDQVRGNATANEWAQDEGLALLLLLERHGPSDWRARLLSPAIPSPVDLLDATVARAGVPPARTFSHGAHARQTLDVYADDSLRGAPILVYVYGGAWRFGSNKAVNHLPAYAQRHGYVLVSVNYRLAPEFDAGAQADDVASAVAWVRAHGTQLGGDTTRVVLFGHSSGAHAVALVGVDGAYLQRAGTRREFVAGFIGLDGAGYDVESQLTLARPFNPQADEMSRLAFGARPRELSPALLVGGMEPVAPWLLYFNTDYPVSVTVHQRFADALRGRGAVVELRPVIGKTHQTMDRDFGLPGDPQGEAAARFIASLRAAR